MADPQTRASMDMDNGTEGIERVRMRLSAELTLLRNKILAGKEPDGYYESPMTICVIELSKEVDRLENKCKRLQKKRRNHRVSYRQLQNAYQELLRLNQKDRNDNQS